jgi:hypothetical protein
MVLRGVGYIAKFLKDNSSWFELKAMKEFLRRRRLGHAIASIEKERDRSLLPDHAMDEGMKILIACGKKIEPLREELGPKR